MKETNHHQGAKEILSQQQHLKQAREKIFHLLDKNFFIVSGDFDTREELKSHLKTLGFSPDHITATNSSAEIINRIKQNMGDVDLIICPFEILNNRASSQTGFQLLNILQEMLFKAGIQETIPFIFMEKSFDKKKIVSAFKVGASQLLIIPTNPIFLANKLVEVFKKPEDSSISQEIIALLFEANKLRKQGLFENAIALYNKALGIGGENVEVITEKADTYLEIGDIEQAIQLYKRAIEIEATFPRVYQGLGRAYEQMGDITEAKKNYLKVLELEPHNVQAYYNVGVLCQKEGDFNKAEFFFYKGITLNKKFIKNYLGLAKNYETEGKPNESMKVYKQALKFNPNQTFLYLSAGDFCLKHNLFQGFWLSIRVNFKSHSPASPQPNNFF